MRDIFIDTNAVVNFTNPPTEGYKKLIEWLKTFSEIKENDPHLVLSKQLLKEYHSSVNGGCVIANNIHLIIALLTKHDRLNMFGSGDISNFQEKYFTKAKIKKLRSNQKDHDHIAIVLMSQRKMGLILDNNFRHDLENFSDAICVQVADCPENLQYSE